MQWSIRNKLIFGGGTIMGIVAISRYFASEQMRVVAAILKHSSTIEAPLTEAGQEMQINLLETGYAVLAYLDDNDPAHLARIGDSSESFSRYLVQYETLALAPRLKDIGRKAKEGFEQFRTLGEQLVRTSDEKSRKMTEALTMFQVMNALIAKKILHVTGTHSPPSGDKRDAAIMMQISLHDFERDLARLDDAVNAGWEARASQSALSFGEHGKRYLRNALSPPGKKSDGRGRARLRRAAEKYRRNIRFVPFAAACRRGIHPDSPDDGQAVG